MDAVVLAHKLLYRSAARAAFDTPDVRTHIQKHMASCHDVVNSSMTKKASVNSDWVALAKSRFDVDEAALNRIGFIALCNGEEIRNDLVSHVLNGFEVMAQKHAEWFKAIEDALDDSAAVPVIEIHFEDRLLRMPKPQNFLELAQKLRAQGMFTKEFAQVYTQLQQAAKDMQEFWSACRHLQTFDAVMKTVKRVRKYMRNSRGKGDANDVYCTWVLSCGNYEIDWEDDPKFETFYQEFTKLGDDGTRYFKPPLKSAHFVYFHPSLTQQILGIYTEHDTNTDEWEKLIPERAALRVLAHMWNVSELYIDDPTIE